MRAAVVVVELVVGVGEAEDDIVVAPDEVEGTPELEVDVLTDPPVVEGDEPEVTPVPIVVELSGAGVVMGSPVVAMVLAMQYHSLALRLAQLMPVFQAERLAAGTPTIEFSSSQVPFYAQCQHTRGNPAECACGA